MLGPTCWAWASVSSRVAQAAADGLSCRLGCTEHAPCSPPSRSFVDIERRDKTVHSDGSEEVEVTPYNKVFIGEVRWAVRGAAGGGRGEAS